MRPIVIPMKAAIEVRVSAQWCQASARSEVLSASSPMSPIQRARIIFVATIPARASALP
jgi:hypothetical protein